MSEMLMAIFMVYSTSGITSGEKFVASLKWRPFWKFWNVEHSFNFTSYMKRSSQILQKQLFSLWLRHRWRHRVVSKFPSIFMLRRAWRDKNWNVRNSYSYVATATKIRFHVATLKILRFLLKTHCRRRRWWYHVPHSSCFCWWLVL